MAQEAGNTLVITTGMTSPKFDIPMRYRLRPHGEAWLIHEAESQRLSCKGSGKPACQTEDVIRRYCGGKGWGRRTDSPR